MLRHNDALILESFGVGGIPSYDGNDFLSVLEEGIQGGKTVVLTTQVQNEGSNVGVYRRRFRYTAECSRPARRPDTDN